MTDFPALIGVFLFTAAARANSRTFEVRSVFSEPEIVAVRTTVLLMSSAAELLATFNF